MFEKPSLITEANYFFWRWRLELKEESSTLRYLVYGVNWPGHCTRLAILNSIQPLLSRSGASKEAEQQGLYQTSRRSISWYRLLCTSRLRQECAKDLLVYNSYHKAISGNANGRWWTGVIFTHNPLLIERIGEMACKYFLAHSRKNCSQLFRKIR